MEEKEIDQNQNQMLVNTVNMMTDKSKCIDLFCKLKLDDDYVYDQQPHNNMFEFKSKKRIIEKMINKIKFVKCFDILKGEVYNFLLLRLIELEKELFVLDVEQGNEVFIPKTLSVAEYPMSFQYYDVVQQLVQENISKNKKENF